MKHYLIFAGTTEGRELVEFLIQKDSVKLTVCTATEYGKILLPIHPNLTVLSKRLDEGQMQTLMRETTYDAVFDATHPYAVIVSQNILAASKEANLTYYRVIRPLDEIGKSENVVTVSSMEEAVDYLEGTTGNILCTTGSKELHKMCKLTNYQERVYARILSNPDMVKESFELGFQGRHLICMQGPFSEELNTALLHQFTISYMVTKDSGKPGGFMEKVESAKKAGVCLILIGRPEREEGMTLEELLKQF